MTNSLNRPKTRLKSVVCFFFLFFLHFFFLFSKFLLLSIGPKIPVWFGSHLSSSLRFFTSTDTVRTIRDRKLRTSTSTFTQFLSSDRLAFLLRLLMLLYVNRDHKDYKGRGAQDGHLDFHAAPKLWHNMQFEFEFNVALRPQRPYGLLGTGNPGRPPRPSRSS